MVTNTVAICAYTAGLIDGEGCLQISKKQHHGCAAYQATIQVATCDTYLPQYLHNNWGGYLIVRKRDPNPVLMWGLSGRKTIIEFIDQVLPYLTLKSDQAKLLKEFCELREYGMKLPVGQRGYSEREHQLFSELRLLHGAQFKHESQIQLT